MKKSEIKPLEEVLREHIVLAYQLVGYRKLPLANALDVSLRTVRNYTNRYNLDGTTKTYLPDEAIQQAKIRTVNQVIYDYIKQAYTAVNNNKTELAKLTGLSVRTIRMFCNKHRLDARRKRKEKIFKEKKEKLRKGQYPKHFNCMQPVTKEERDSWYNRDYF